MMSVPSASDRYIDRLLRSAVAPADAAGHPIAGRIMVRLLLVVGASASHDLINKYLTPVPGTHATFEVRSSAYGERGHTILAGGLNAAVALREALLLARGDADRVDVVGRTPAGLERRVFARDDGGGLTFLFPAFDTYHGPVADVRDALQQWAETMSEWREAIGEPALPASPAASFDAPTGAGSGMAATDEMVRAVQAALGEMTVDVNLAEMESMIRRTIEDASRARSADGMDLGSDDGGLVDGDELAERVAARVTEQVKHILPAPIRLGPLPTGPDGRQASETAIHLTVLTRILGAIEALEVQMTALRDQGRMSSADMQSLTEQMVRDARRSDAAAQRLALMLREELDRLARRVEDRLDDAALSGSGSGDAPAPAEVVDLALGNRGRPGVTASRRPKGPSAGSRS